MVGHKSLVGGAQLGAVGLHYFGLGGIGFQIDLLNVQLPNRHQPLQLGESLFAQAHAGRHIGIILVDLAHIEIAPRCWLTRLGIDLDADLDLLAFFIQRSHFLEPLAVHIQGQLARPWALRRDLHFRYDRFTLLVHLLGNFGQVAALVVVDAANLTARRHDGHGFAQGFVHRLGARIHFV